MSIYDSQEINAGEVKFCSRCVVSNKRPRITFDKNNICSACLYTEYKNKEIDWEKRERQLVELLDKHKSRNGSFDCIVPCSGGKDGSYVAHTLKFK